MPKYRVTVREIALYTVEVEAKNATEAEEIGEETVMDGISCPDDFTVSVEERDVWNVELVDGLTPGQQRIQQVADDD